MAEQKKSMAERMVEVGDSMQSGGKKVEKSGCSIMSFMIMLVILGVALLALKACW